MSDVVKLAINTVRERHGIEAWPPGYAEAVDASITSLIATLDYGAQPAIFAAAGLLKTILREAEEIFANERKAQKSK